MTRYRGITYKECGSTGFVLWGSEPSKRHRKTGLCPDCQGASEKRTELDKILTKIECGLGSGDTAFYIMARDRLKEYIEKETVKNESAVR